MFGNIHLKNLFLKKYDVIEIKVHHCNLTTNITKEILLKCCSSLRHVSNLDPMIASIKPASRDRSEIPAALLGEALFDTSLWLEAIKQYH